MDGLEQQMQSMAKDGFGLMVYLMLGIAGAFLAWGLIKWLIAKIHAYRKKQRAKKKTKAKAHDPNKWEREWQHEQIVEARKGRSVSSEVDAKKQKEMEDRRETYRLNRKNNQWKK